MDVTDGTFAPLSGGGSIGAVQLPVSLPPRPHGQLTRWCRQTASELNVTALARGDVLEALLAELVADAATTDAIRKRLRGRLAPQPAASRPGSNPATRLRVLGR